jgi:hypothetical protein
MMRRGLHCWWPRPASALSAGCILGTMIANGGTRGTSDRQPIECYDPRTWPDPRNELPTPPIPAAIATPPSATLRPAPHVLPQQMMAAGYVVPLELRETLAKEQEDNKRLRTELHHVQAELHHVHQTGNRLEADRAKFEKLSLERWNEIQELKAINVLLRSEIKVLQGTVELLQGTVSSLTQKVDRHAAELQLQKEMIVEQNKLNSQQAARLSQVEAELQNRKPLQASIALGQMQTGLNNSYRDFWALFFDKNVAKQVPVFMSITAMLRHRRETPNQRITTDHDACFDAFMKEHPALAESDVMDIFLEVACAGAYPAWRVHSEGDCRAYFREMFPGHEVDFPRRTDLYIGLFFKK